MNEMKFRGGILERSKWYAFKIFGKSARLVKNDFS